MSPLSVCRGATAAGHLSPSSTTCLSRSGTSSTVQYVLISKYVLFVHLVLSIFCPVVNYLSIDEIIECKQGMDGWMT